jgi:predicted 3-demethylubiquinone-9 3-methyltransferase (glyoxalase superfamily)
MKEGFEIHGREAGSVLTVEFQINGQAFTAEWKDLFLNLAEAISFQIL